MRTVQHNGRQASLAAVPTIEPIEADQDTPPARRARPLHTAVSGSRACPGICRRGIWRHCACRNGIRGPGILRPGSWPFAGGFLGACRGAARRRPGTLVDALGHVVTAQRI